MEQYAASNRCVSVSRHPFADAVLYTPIRANTSLGPRWETDPAGNEERDVTKGPTAATVTAQAREQTLVKTSDRRAGTPNPRRKSDQLTQGLINPGFHNNTNSV